MRLSLPTVDEEGAMDFIHALVQQENNKYYTNNRFDWLTSISHDDDTKDEEPTSSEPTPDMYCRTTIIGWYYDVIDALRMNTVIVEIAASYLDRFMSSTKKGKIKVSYAEFELISITCLYLAIKLHGNIIFSTNAIVQLSNQVHITAKQIEQMEMNILQALNWRMHPPTTEAYIYAIIDIVMVSCGDVLLLDKEDEDMIVKIALIQTEHYYVTDTNLFFHAKPSLIAYCSFINALESYFSSFMEDSTISGYISTRIAGIIGIKYYNNPAIHALQHRLHYNAIAQHNLQCEQHLHRSNTNANNNNYRQGAEVEIIKRHENYSVKENERHNNNNTNAHFVNGDGSPCAILSNHSNDRHHITSNSKRERQLRIKI